MFGVMWAKCSWDVIEIGSVTEVGEKRQLSYQASDNEVDARKDIYRQEMENFDLAYKNLQGIHGQLARKRDKMKVLRDGVCLQIYILSYVYGQKWFIANGWESSGPHKYCGSLTNHPSYLAQVAWWKADSLEFSERTYSC